MGGAILSIKARTQEKLNEQVNETIQQAEENGLSDLRDLEFFAPGTYVKPDGNSEDQWMAVIFVHS